MVVLHGEFCGPVPDVLGQGREQSRRPTSTRACEIDWKTYSVTPMLTPTSLTNIHGVDVGCSNG